ncbi:hypothetical protein EVAR_11409_1 [Eumeta japonica]|uniref:Uncharacterized protein n=1 Tax=Eumeta variegata TaxID=151549 RepID=A0A4C1TM10_EUMVA|nr:hypothetical protein EVAR_11409_1 [Eumeta japonica]
MRDREPRWSIWYDCELVYVFFQSCIFQREDFYAIPIDATCHQVTLRCTDFESETENEGERWRKETEIKRKRRQAKGRNGTKGRATKTRERRAQGLTSGSG